jgi:hypothetical protein
MKSGQRGLKLLKNDYSFSGGIYLKSYGLALLILGIFLVSLSGLEKIILYASLNERVHDIESLKMITPSEIWTITKMTFIFGILTLIIGLTMSLWEIIKKEMEKIKEANRQFEIEHGINRKDHNE